MKHLKLLLPLVLLLLAACNDDASDLISGAGVFTTVSGEASIEGELFLPDGQGPFPVLIIVPGSGTDTRESVEPFVPVFNSMGYALYTYDKRGLGGSTGTYPVETIKNPFDFLAARAEDVIGIVELLKEHIDIRSDKITLFGSSQGTWVNCLVYEQMRTELASMVLTSGGAVSTGVEHYYEEILENNNYSVEEANQMMQQYDGEPGFDPAPILRETTVPILFIYGGKDVSHPTQYDQQLVEDMRKSNFVIHFYENADHELVDVTTGSTPSDLFINLESWLISTD